LAAFYWGDSFVCRPGRQDQDIHLGTAVKQAVFLIAALHLHADIGAVERSTKQGLTEPPVAAHGEQFTLVDHIVAIVHGLDGDRIVVAAHEHHPLVFHPPFQSLHLPADEPVGWGEERTPTLIPNQKMLGFVPTYALYPFSFFFGSVSPHLSAFFFGTPE